MFLNALHMRFAAVGAGVVVVALFIAFGGSLGSPEVIQLDFAMYPEVFEGAEVEIDGRVVGRLERTGQALRSGFEVDPGEHVVRVLHPTMGSQEMRLTVRKAEKVRVLLDMVESYDAESGRSTTLIAGQF